jgi:2-iminobutanoate/2-iminopropanoate deaminase
MRPNATVLSLVVAGVVTVTVQPQPSARPFSPSVAAGGLIYLSGVLAADAQGRVSGDVRQQTRAVLERIRATLATHERSWQDAVATTVYLKRAEDFAAMNEVYKTFVGDAPSTRTTVVANLVVPEALIEVSVVAAAPGTTRRVLHPASWLRSPNPYSYAVEAGDTVFLSGLVARNPVDNSAIPGDMAAQSRAVLENAKALLASAGLTLDHVVSARVYVTDLAAFDTMNEVYRSYFRKDPPARATVRAALMHPSNLVEMTFVASRTPKEVIAGDGPVSPNLSAAIRVGPRLYVSGTLGLDAQPRNQAGAQTRATLQRIGSVLTRAGFDWKDVADSLVYLASTDNVAAMNDAYRSVLSAPFPARTTVEAGLAAPGGLVEIVMTAVKR